MTTFTARLEKAEARYHAAKKAGMDEKKAIRNFRASVARASQESKLNRTLAAYFAS